MIFANALPKGVVWSKADLDTVVDRLQALNKWMAKQRVRVAKAKPGAALVWKAEANELAKGHSGHTAKLRNGSHYQIVAAVAFPTNDFAGYSVSFTFSQHVAPCELHRPLTAQHPEQHEDPFSRRHAGIEPVQSGERARTHLQFIAGGKGRSRRLRLTDRRLDVIAAIAQRFGMSVDKAAKLLIVGRFFTSDDFSGVKLPPSWYSLYLLAKRCDLFLDRVAREPCRGFLMFAHHHHANLFPDRFFLVGHARQA